MVKDVLDCEGISWAFGCAVLQVLQQDLEMCKIAARCIPHHLNEVQHWMHYEACHINLEWFNCKEDNMLNWLIAIIETWTRSFKPEFKEHSSKGITHSHHKNARFDEVSHPWSWWSFWHTASKVFLCIITFHRVGLWIHSITSHTCSTSYIVWAGRSVLCLFKISLYVVVGRYC
jgi:hypothetical protein